MQTSDRFQLGPLGWEGLRACITSGGSNGYNTEGDECIRDFTKSESEVVKLEYTEGDQCIRDFKKSESEVVKLEYRMSLIQMRVM